MRYQKEFFLLYEMGKQHKKNQQNLARMPKPGWDLNSQPPQPPASCHSNARQRPFAGGMRLAVEGTVLYGVRRSSLYQIIKLWVITLSKTFKILPIFTWKVPKGTGKLVLFGAFQTKTDKICLFWKSRNFCDFSLLKNLTSVLIK